MELYRGLDEAVLPEVIDNKEIPFVIRLIRGSDAVMEALEVGKLDPLLEDISTLYREVFGGKPWDEYLVCPDGHNTNYQTVYGQDGSLAELERNRPDSYDCPHEDCGKETTLFYPPSETLETFRDKINRDIVTTLAFSREDKRLAGVCLGWITTLEKGWADKVIVGTGDLTPEERQPYEDYLEEAKTFFPQIGFPDVNEQTKVLNSSDWLVGAKDRKSGLAIPLLWAQYVATKKIMGGNIPIVGEALVGTKSHAIFSLGAKMGKSLPSGICRVYSTLDMAIDCLDKVTKKDHLNPRKTDVLEFTCSTPIGTDEEAEEKIKKFLVEAAKDIGSTPLREPEAHLSEKYGFSGWVPLEKSRAIHMYAWDNEESVRLPFISIDISTPHDDVNVDAVEKTADKFFGIEEMRGKTSKSDEGWEDLAPEITRQRMNVTAKLKAPTTPEKVSQVLEDLTTKIEMQKISDVMVVDEGNSKFSSWMHWESSGIVANWDGKGNFSIDIYTCKSFDPKVVIEFLKKELGFKRQVSCNF